MEREFRPNITLETRLLELLKAGEPVALTQVVGTEGSTPQVPGAAALFTRDGLVAGTVGGGTAEAKTQKAAARALRTGRSVLLSFDLAGEVNLDADGVCGGAMRILVDADPGRHRSVFAALVRAGRARRPGLLAVLFRPERRNRGFAVRRAWIPAARPAARLKALGLARFRDEAAAAAAENKPRLAAAKPGWIYLEPRRPAPRLIIAGAGHVGLAVARLGVFLGFAVEIIDDRPEFASPERFPGVERVTVGDPARVLERAAIDGTTSIVLVTRGHRHDAAALRACIRRPAAYIGMIGSRRKVGLLRDEFLARGWASAAQWDRIHSPIGLPIGSRTVEEIAVSIAAELVAVRRGGSR
jgi:xanthine dehydrogenase accessory factor